MISEVWGFDEIVSLGGCLGRRVDRQCCSACSFWFSGGFTEARAINQPALSQKQRVLGIVFCTTSAVCDRASPGVRVALASSLSSRHESNTTTGRTTTTLVACACSRAGVCLVFLIPTLMSLDSLQQEERRKAAIEKARAQLSPLRDGLQSLRDAAKEDGRPALEEAVEPTIQKVRAPHMCVCVSFRLCVSRSSAPRCIDRRASSACVRLVVCVFTRVVSAWMGASACLCTYLSP